MHRGYLGVAVGNGERASRRRRGRTAQPGGVYVPDVVAVAAEVETGVQSKVRRRAALDESLLGGGAPWG